eukprot:gene21192-23921_t
MPHVMPGLVLVPVPAVVRVAICGVTAALLARLPGTQFLLSLDIVRVCVPSAGRRGSAKTRVEFFALPPQLW